MYVTGTLSNSRDCSMFKGFLSLRNQETYSNLRLISPVSKSLKGNSNLHFLQASTNSGSKQLSIYTKLTFLKH